MNEETSLNTLLKECEKEQLQHSAAIQPFGVLLAIDIDSGCISHASENASDLLGEPLPNIFGATASDILGFDVTDISGWNDQSNTRTSPCIRTLPTGLDYEVMVTRQNTRALIQLEPCNDSATAKPSLPLQSFHFSIPKTKAKEKNLHRELAETIQQQTGFEKVMVYQFHDDWSGEVIEEVATGDNLDLYLGLRFPASDIPEIARRIYEQTAFRLISDVSCSPVPILGEEENGRLDLTHVDLRSVSPVHIQYLKNMNVGASFSLSIMLSNKLWGLVACHHTTPRHLPLATRAQCAETVKNYVLSLSSWRAEARTVFFHSLKRTLSEAFSKSRPEDTLAERIQQSGDTFLDLIGASSCAFIDDQSMVSLGITPPEEAIQKIDAWFVDHCQERTLITQKLSDHYPEAGTWKDRASGLVGIKLPQSKLGFTGPRFYWFRPEVQQIVNWGGNPDKRVSVDTSQVILSPRKSFEVWTEHTSAQSEGWPSEARMVADFFRSNVLISHNK